MGPDQFAGTGAKVKEIAFSEKIFCAGLIENNAGVDSRGNLKCDAGWDVGFNNACNDGGARGLSGDDKVNASRTGFGGEKGDRVFDFGGGDLHKIGELIDDYDNVGKAIRKRFFR